MITIANNYILKSHELFYARSAALNKEVEKLQKRLSENELMQHEVIRLARNIYKATFQVIPENPNRPEYRLSGKLRKYRRYKRGLKRYRLFFGFTNQPKIILYFYLNDRNHLRKEGDKNDPYKQFEKFTRQGKVSHNPSDPAIQKWIRDYSFL